MIASFMIDPGYRVLNNRTNSIFESHTIQQRSVENMIKMSSRISIGIFLSILLILLLQSSAYAEITGVAEVNPRLIRAGSTFQIILTITSDENVSPLIPAFPTPDGVTLSNGGRSQGVQMTSINGVTSYNRTFSATYTADEEGEYEIGPFRISFEDSDEVVQIDPVSIEVYDDAPRPASGIIESEFRFPWKILIVILLVAFLAALIVAWFRLRKKKPKTEHVLETSIFKSPEQAAYEEIAGLTLPDENDEEAVKAYYDKVDDVLRKYLFKRYTVSTRDTTTFEIQMEFVRRQRLDNRAKGVFGLMNDCDWVKFAKSRPTATDIGRVKDRVADVLLGITPSWQQTKQ